MDLFELFVVIVDRPWLALFPAAVFGAAGWWARARSAMAAAAAWAIYCVYEWAMQARLLCSGECNIRVDLLLIAPALLLLSLVAIARLAMRLARGTAS